MGVGRGVGVGCCDGGEGGAGEKGVVVEGVDVEGDARLGEWFEGGVCQVGGGG